MPATFSGLLLGNLSNASNGSGACAGAEEDEVVAGTGACSGVFFVRAVVVAVTYEAIPHL